MGSFGSGRRRSANSGRIDDALKLDLRLLRRLGHVQVGQTRQVEVEWRTGQHLHARAAVGLAVDGSGRGTACIVSPGGRQEQQITIVSDRLYYGGRRYYFVCPKLGHRCEVLAFKSGEFASRQAHRLTYATQSSGKVQGLRLRRAKLRIKALGVDGAPRPRGSNRRRLEAAYAAADHEYMEALASRGRKILGLSPS